MLLLSKFKMIQKTNQKRERDKIRKWGVKNKEEIFKAFNYKCAECS